MLRPLTRDGSPRQIRGSAVIKIGQRRQRTLAHSVDIAGVGFITGTPVSLRLRPAPADAGLAFRRTDIRTNQSIPARAENVTGTKRRTTVGEGVNQITLAEHVLAALTGLRIDNCLIEIDGPEPPGLDGSALAFVEAIEAAGVVMLNATRSIWTVSQPIVLKQEDATLGIYPTAGETLRISYILDYGPLSPIMPQTHSETITPDNFQQQLANCRTFVLREEAAYLQEQGIGKHLTTADLLVFGTHGPIENHLRHANEPARHKMLDIIGDLALTGLSLAGHIVAYRSGHPLNVEMAKTISRMARMNSGSHPLRLAA
ncbi:MAG: UDP-3-O-acyl-N-acetylglucosamine deacetylase [Planctomycetes bacterium]|nr:UDP-3-O-acyl-N-acetylglucosamine deacetylase [Planctomycetota bacterium]